MPQTFSYDNGISTWLDYARWRLDDLDDAEPFMWNETYLALLRQFGPVQGLALAASQIAVQISKQVTAFGEAAGIRFTKGNLDYYEKLAVIIRGEPAFGAGVRSRLIRSGKIKTGMSARASDIWNICTLEPVGVPCLNPLSRCEN